MKAKDITLMGLMMALVIVMTLIIHIPVPATSGYIHLGDCMIFFSVLLLGRNKSTVVAGVGSAMADFFAGYTSYMFITLIVKGLMAFVMGAFIEYAINKGFTGTKLSIMNKTGMFLAGLIMCLGYYLGESIILYGNFITPLAAIPMNIVQFVVGIILASILADMLGKTELKSKFSLINN